MDGPNAYAITACQPGQRQRTACAEPQAHPPLTVAVLAPMRLARPILRLPLSRSFRYLILEFNGNEPSLQRKALEWANV